MRPDTQVEIATILEAHLHSQRKHKKAPPFHPLTFVSHSV
jgi:hypothetical protein